MCKLMFLTRRPYMKTISFAAIGTKEIVTPLSLLTSTQTKGTPMSSTTTLTTISTSSVPPNFQNVYSPQNREQTISNIHNKKTGFKFQKSAFMRKAAVLIPLCYDITGKPAILYTLRSLNMNKHSGEISFPGGASDPEDQDDDIATALRETEEELGIPRDAVDIWTTMDPMPTLISLMGVTPVIGFLKLGNLDPSKLKISPNEVEEPFTISLEHLCDPSNWREKMRMGFPMPIFKNLNIRHPKQAETDEPPDVKLWGLTGIITHIVLEALLPELYTRRISFLEGDPKSKL